MHVRGLFVFISLMAFIFLIPQRAEAHVGNVPFLQINGKYTLVNPTYQTKSLLNVAQDVAPVLYRDSTPLSFLIDTGRLPFSPLIVHRSVFRWSFYSGATFSEKEPGYVYGESITHTFSRSGSHVVVLEAEIPGGNFSVIDTVLVHVVPFLDYQYPTVSVSVQQDRNGHEVFIATALTDRRSKKTSYYWDVGKDKILQDKRIELGTYDLNSFPKTGISLRAVDDQGMSVDVLLRQETFTKKVIFSTVTYAGGVFADSYGNLGIVSTPEVLSAQATNYFALYLTPFFSSFAILLVCGVLGGGMFWVYVRRK